MDGTEQARFDAHYDAGTSTLALVGQLSREDWTRLLEELDHAFRRTACQLTVDLSRTAGLPAHDVGRLVQVCNRCYPGTLVRPPLRRPDPAQTPAVVPAA